MISCGDNTVYNCICKMICMLEGLTICGKIPNNNVPLFGENSTCENIGTEPNSATSLFLLWGRFNTDFPN